MKYFVISDNADTQTGLRLAGIDGVIVHEKDEVHAAIQSAVGDKSIGILLITENLARMCDDLIYDLKLKLHSPLLVEIPDRHGTARTPDSITRYVREAIGIKVL